MLSFKNFFAHPATTIGGALFGLFQAALGSAAAAFTQSGNLTDWKPYAVAAATGATTFVVGGLLPSATPAPAAVPIGPETQVVAPVDPKAAILSTIDTALAQAAQVAMVAEANKIAGVKI